MEEVICPFCDKQISKQSKKTDQCCDQPEIVKDNIIVCKKCGTVQGYTPLIEYVDFYQNKHRFYRKSIYQRKYYIEKIINGMAEKNDFQITVKNKDKILRIFDEIGKVIQSVNKDRKRMININFILQKIFKMLNLPHEKIKTMQSEITLEKYDQYWKDIMSLISDEITKIIQE